MGEEEFFSARLRELRTAAGLTQAELSDKSGVGQQTISSLEKGQAPVWGTLLRLASALGVTCEAFTQPPAELGTKSDVRTRKPAGDGPQVSDGAKPQPLAIETKKRERAEGGKKGKGRGKK